MTIDASAQTDAGERAALPPLRAFGETNALTVPRARRRADRSDMAARVVAAATEAAPALRVGIVAADEAPLTLTF